MDPVSALSVAAAVVQFIDFGSRLLSKTSNIYNSESPGQLDLKIITKDMVRVTEKLDEGLKASSLAERAELSTEEQELQQLCQECNHIASQLSEALADLKPPKHQFLRTSKLLFLPKWESFYQALRSIWAEEKIEALQKRLDEFRKQLVFKILVLLRNQDDIVLRQQSSMMEKLENIDSNTRNPGKRFLQQIDERTRWETDLIHKLSMEKSQLRDAVNGSMSDKELKAARGTDQFQSASMKFLEALSFPEINDRPERIVDAYKKTLEWVYRDPVEGAHTWANFADWLRDVSKSSLYWITGKPGSGKSTLMKFLYYSPLTEATIQSWSPTVPLVTLAFFFWNSGSRIQKSQPGLLRTLLYQALSKHIDLIPRVCPKRWDVCRLFGYDPFLWTREDLLQAMGALVQEGCKTNKFFLLIDGLDEFEGVYEEQQDLVTLLRDIAKSPNVKMCVSSRPWQIFKDSFRFDPSLMLQHLTYQDMRFYVRTKLDQNPGFAELKRRDAGFSTNLADEIVQKSSGVWLWVYLVMRSLLEAFTYGARISDVRRIVDGLPTELEMLFKKILNSLEPTYLEQASQIFQVFRAGPASFSLLLFSFADEECDDFALQLKCNPLSNCEKLGRAQSASRRLNSLTKGLLEVRSPLTHRATTDASQSIDEHIIFQCPDNDSHASKVQELRAESKSADELARSKIMYLHRTVKDYFEKDEVWRELIAHTKPTFNAYACICRGFLIHLKTMNDYMLSRAAFWDVVISCMSYALRAEKTGAPGEGMVRLLDEIDRAAGEVAERPNRPHGCSILQSHHINRKMPLPHWTTLQFRNLTESSFLCFAVEFRLLHYVKMKLDQGCSVEQGPDCWSLLDCGMMSREDFTDIELREDVADISLETKLFKLLLERGADPNRVYNGSITTPWKNLLKKAREKPNLFQNWTEVMELFILHGADPKVKLKGVPAEQALRDLMNKRKRSWYRFGRISH